MYMRAYTYIVQSQIFLIKIKHIYKKIFKFITFNVCLSIYYERSMMKLIIMEKLISSILFLGQLDLIDFNYV